MQKLARDRKPKPELCDRQFAAVPVRLAQDGSVQVLLITSRRTGRWLVPRGWPMRKLEPEEAAAREAYEEAGVDGEIMPGGPVGTYRYRKTAQPGGKLIEVQVFLLRVKRQHATWPEAHERERRWFSPAEAAVLVHEPDLRAILIYACGLVISGVTSAAT